MSKVILFCRMLGFFLAAASISVASSEVAHYQNDFLSNEPSGNWDSGWRYFWNAPDGWVASSNPQNLDTGYVGDISSYRLLESSPSGWTADGDDNGANSQPDAYLKLTSTGGHPGKHVTSENLHARYAIVAYKVAASGLYSITESTLQKPSTNGDGVEVMVYTQGFISRDRGVVEPGQTENFDRCLGYLSAGEVIYVAVGSGGTAYSDAFNMDFKIVMDEGTEVAAYGNDFETTAPLTGRWSYLWNAPDGWTSTTGGGDHRSGFIGIPGGYAPLMNVASVWTPDGNTLGTDHEPAAYLKLTASGGHPGKHVTSTNTRARYAIAAYRVEEAGFYAIENSALEKTSTSGDGLEVLVFPGISGAILKREAPVGSEIDFDTDVGFLEAEETIYVAIGSGATASSDAFTMDFEIVRYAVASLQDQVDAALNASDSVVRLVPGRYYSKSTTRPLLLSGESDFEIIADDVSLICQNNHRAVEFNDCSNVAMSGLKVDYDPLLFAQGTIEDYSPGSIDVRLHEGYPHPPEVDSFSGVVYEPSGDQPMRSGCYTRYPSKTSPITELEPNLFRIPLTHPRYDEAQQGDLFTLTQPNGVPHAIALVDSSTVTLRDITIHGSPSFALYAKGGEGSLDFERIRIEPGATPLLASQKRLLSSSADGIHIKDTGGDIRIADCSLAYNGDDCIALSSLYLGVLDVTSSAITVASKYAKEVAVGDELAIYLKDSMSIGHSSVQSVVASSLSSSAAQTLWDTHFPDASANIQAANVKVIHLSSPVSCEPGDFIANLDSSNAGFEVTGCRIENTRARGILIKSSGDMSGSAPVASLVSNNVVRNSWLAGVQLRPEPATWMEADFTQHVDILDNELRACGLSPNSKGALRVDLEDLDWDPGAGHYDLRIVGNEIYDTPGCSVFIRYAQLVDVKDNLFDGTHHDYWVDPVWNRSVVWLEEVDSVSFSGTNTVRNLDTTNADSANLIGVGDGVSNLNVGTGLTQ